MTRIKIKKKVVDILTEALFIYGSKITEYDRVFDDFGADEEEINDIAHWIEAEFDIEFTREELLRFGKMSLREIVDTIADKTK